MTQNNNSKKLLILDDDKNFSRSIAEYFSAQHFNVYEAHTGKSGEQICRNQNIDMVLLDQKLPDIKGAELCEKILGVNDQTKIIFMTAFPNFENAVNAIRLGAHDYLSKPFEIEELQLAVDRALRTQELEKIEQIQLYRERRETRNVILIGNSGLIKDVKRLISLSAKNDATVLITGETGTGKNLVAKAIHYQSDRNKGAFIPINCAALPDNLIESELFGHEKGAFTGAETSRKGVFEMAEGGTLFLDEIGELPLHLQTKLLGVLDERQIKRIGGQTMRPVNVRVIAATNLDIETAMQNRRFRRDLYYRLHVIGIYMPPLRQRIEDIPELCDHFINRYSEPSELKLSDDEITVLKGYKWPGNVRELKNIIERAVILKADCNLHPSHLIGNSRLEVAHYVDNAQVDEKIKTLEELEEHYIRYTMKKFDNNHTKVAHELGISRSTLLRKLKKIQS